LQNGIGGIHFEWVEGGPTSFLMTHVFFIRDAGTTLDIGGLLSDSDSSNMINKDNVIYSLSRSMGNISKVDFEGTNKSYLLLEDHPSPFYVAQLSTSEFHTANKPYCGTEYVRCITLSYAIGILNPDIEYSIYVENGNYIEDAITVSVGQSLTIRGKSSKYTLLNPNFPGLSFFFFCCCCCCYF
jgi:hypothetical protein